MYDILKEQGVLPLITKIGTETAKILVQSAADSEIKIIEFAARSEDSKEVFAQMVQFRNVSNLNVKLAVGSVLSARDAAEYHKLGADCIVCPHIDPQIAAYCNENNLYWIPGAATLNEILYANKLGAEIVKLFPADAIGGANYVKAIRSPFPQLKLMPTGGVRLDEDNLNEWFSAGVVCVGIGSHLFSAETLVNLNYQKALEVFKYLKDTVQKIKNQHGTKLVGNKS
ncbi:bifunctional 4-hydroxy-2-oxoglutarate aldolase/2-dehydro-3-deoxy-phosphogluconate aldolase [Elizabethkingia anophelis]|uniref:bifunctional 4-hydroxy-2-oxoglutarate aldolase/2-dehydro-3-deoxy-phosphogluconate aldolase n=1 Tax=Elizabethkingia anophelis TaxID=1117645 RepID=UPI0012B21226|nr:aldolase [Elizabethkingia anophelis]QGN23653.1 aldolase [Elizabethkingia anophelis]QNV10296.1 aldolase [Elizabethkingia anophelis]UTF88443.1 aldolase [Elizabethkingia anophelis]UTF99345.1 aldolase [Elizabethkingia anophelis]UTG03079.1 aldolase [Elizabethkingia anophelis]